MPTTIRRAFSVALSATVGGALWAATTLLAGCQAESAAVSGCNRYVSAYCDYYARCVGGTVDEARQTCLTAYARSLDCSQATQSPLGLERCIGALGGAACSSAALADCAAVADSLPTPPVSTTTMCQLDPTASPEAQAKMLAFCAADRVSGVLIDKASRPVLDVLFLVDNSPSMSPKQAALAKAIPPFIRYIDELGADYHIAIATSDVGTNVAVGMPWGGSVGSCDSFAGDDGKLQAVACTTRTGTTPDARNACTELCPDAKFVPVDGNRYISKVDGVTNVPVSMEFDPASGRMVDRGPEKAFKCMALVGDGGCGVEGTLEGAKRALDGHNAENRGFLRPGSTLMVVIMTDEDDCSVAGARRNENNPLTRDCDPSKPDSYDCYNLDFRCFARSVACTQSMLTPGVKSGCSERAGNYLDPVEKYTQFFKTLRPADRLVVGGIWTLPSVPSGGHVEVSRTVGGTTSPFLNRAQGSGASCVSARSSAIFGQAQLRLSKFATSLPGTTESSICDIDNYDSALQDIAARAQTKATAVCLAKPPLVRGDEPACLVGDVPAENPNQVPASTFLSCSTTCCAGWASTDSPVASDPIVQSSCQDEPSSACYCALPSSDPSICPGGAVVGIWRKDGAPPPTGKVTTVRCINR